MDRKEFLRLGGMSTLAVALGSSGLLSFGGKAMADAGLTGGVMEGFAGSGGYGPLVKDPGGVLDLPRGFQYRIISEEGGRLSNGAPIPGAFDGMAAFPGKHNTTILVRNHELISNAEYPVNGKNPYDRTAAGGTTALIIGADRKVQSEYIASSGTIRNCAGGGTPWGTWLTCEETSSGKHGYVFEVDPLDPENERSRTPIREMGFFSHEACDVDPSTGIVYLTEDANPSFLYRFIPNDRSQKPGALQSGGILQAAAFEELADPRASVFKPGQSYGIVWKDLKPEEAHNDALAKGCIQFSRLEGSYFSGGVFWFDDTSAGEKKLGRIYRYTPSTNTLELFYEASDANEMEMPDNICITPWGDLWFVEDGGGTDRLLGITPEREVYLFAVNRLNNSELCGPAFSPDGNTLFLNIQDPGITFAVWGPFKNRSAARQRQMSHAAPPKGFAPLVSDKLAAYAEIQGMSLLEAAAMQRHGVPVL
ncbi:PhoX family protein [Paenibacillus sp. sptzw28]|nr:PhoX family protein [Paenibacillus sp. sptzw28]